MLAMAATMAGCEKDTVEPVTPPKAYDYLYVHGDIVDGTTSVTDFNGRTYDFKYLVWFCADTATFNPSVAPVDTIHGNVGLPIMMDMTWNGGDASLYYVIGYRDETGRKYKMLLNGSTGELHIPALIY